MRPEPSIEDIIAIATEELPHLIGEAVDPLKAAETAAEHAASAAEPGGEVSAIHYSNPGSPARPEATCKQ